MAIAGLLSQMPPEANPEDHVRTVVLGGRARNAEAAGGASMAAFGTSGAPGLAPGVMHHGGVGMSPGAAGGMLHYAGGAPFVPVAPSPGPGGYGAPPTGGYGATPRGGAGLPAGAW